MSIDRIREVLKRYRSQVERPAAVVLFHTRVKDALPAA